MESRQFEEALKRLEAAFSPLTREEKNIYFDHLKKYHIVTFKRGVELVISTHRYKSIPTVAEVIAKCNEAREDLSSRTYGDIPEDRRYAVKCLKCQDTGYVLVEERRIKFHGSSSPDGMIPYTTAKYCNCSGGKDMRSGHIAAMREGRL